MRFFGPSRRKPAEPDANFPGLDREKANDLRTELRKAAEQRGAAIRINGRMILLDHPRLGKVSADVSGAVRQLGSSVHPKASQRIATSLVDQMLASPQGQGSETASVYASLRPRLVSVEDGQGTFTSDTATTIVLDTGQGFKTMSDDALSRIDDPETLRHAASVNLRADIESTFDVQVSDHGGGVVAIEAVGSELASAATELELVLDTFAPRIPRDKGLLFAIPAHGTILVSPVGEGEELVASLNHMAKVAVTYPTRQPLSRLLHFWHEGHVDTLSSFDQEARAIVITPNDYLTRLLRFDGNPEG
ncbi:hypothetical protein [Corynebacterium lubricantis]|uniref:hypothetical protein n=1 Tax=Corynebacterium lubricantis TaxID=541095 RepID=UPI0003A3EBA8|nr:hypothetical protein [Corynebacterium lubricantis]